MSRRRNVVVWGNCQAAPLGTLLTEAMGRHGLRVVPVPPVFELDHAALDRVRNLVADAAFLLSQPIRDEYSIGGCGTEQLAGYLPPGGQLIRLPSAFDSAAYPFQVTAHGADGVRVAAPLTDYHDLRVISAAAAGMSADDLLAAWPTPPADAIARHARLSMDALVARETGCDVVVSDVVRNDRGMFCVNHPSNATLGHLARKVLRLLGLDGAVVLPKREFLGAIRSPVEAEPAALLRWTPDPAPRWVIGGSDYPWAEVARRHLVFYRDRPDVIADTARRFTARLAALGMGL